MEVESQEDFEFLLSRLSAVVGCTAEQAMETSKLLFIKPQKKCVGSAREQHNGEMVKSECVFSRVGRVGE